MASKHRARRPSQVARSVCRQCERTPTEENPLSSRLLCRECAIVNISAPGLELINREGPAYEQWLKSCRQAFDRMAAG